MKTLLYVLCAACSLSVTVFPMQNGLSGNISSKKKEYKILWRSKQTPGWFEANSVDIQKKLSLLNYLCGEKCIFVPKWRELPEDHILQKIKFTKKQAYTDVFHVKLDSYMQHVSAFVKDVDNFGNVYFKLQRTNVNEDGKQIDLSQLASETCHKEDVPAIISRLKEKMIETKMLEIKRQEGLAEAIKTNIGLLIEKESQSPEELTFRISNKIRYIKDDINTAQDKINNYLKNDLNNAYSLTHLISWGINDQGVMKDGIVRGILQLEAQVDVDAQDNELQQPTKKQKTDKD